MVTQVKNNIYQITRGANIFILKTAADEVTVIDTGLPGGTRGILKAVRELGMQPSNVRHILITHADLDHVGSLAGLAKKTGARVYAGADTKQHVEQRTMPPHMPGLLATIIKPVQKLVQGKVTVDHVVNDGDILSIGGGIRAMHTPGHTPDNFSYYWPAEGALFAPDLLNTLGGTLGLTQARITWDMDTAKASTRKVLALEPTVICVGHGDAVKAPDPQIDALKDKVNAAGE